MPQPVKRGSSISFDVVPVAQLVRAPVCGTGSREFNSLQAPQIFNIPVVLFMKISLIGMSNTGKSFWAKELEKIGFISYCCDDLIEEGLGQELKKLGYSGIADVSKWMGQPYDPRYTQTSQKYLTLESQVLHDIFQAIEKAVVDSCIVVDTTGSVIYTGADILKKLAKLTRVVYLEAPTSVQRQMYDLYIKEPKPVIWGNVFNKRQGEANLAALDRCYPELLRSRAAMYKQIAPITMDYFKLRRPDFTVNEFIESLA